jgi:hypothetical protein
MSDVAILRRAANLLRERATGATPGPWEGYARLPVVLAPREEWDLGEGRQRIAHMCMPYREERKWANAAYITLMHPPVALALADWLDDEAARGLGRPDNLAAYAVARAVLREAGE